MARPKKTDAEKKAAAAESKADKFVRLAKNRTNKALNAIALLGNLAGSQYEYTDEQVEAIVTALNNETAKVKSRFTKAPGKDKPSFDFS